MKHFLPTLQDPMGRIYHCEELPIHGSMGSLAFRVYKPDGTDHYDVHLSGEGTLECSCADYQCRKKGTDLLCKHGQALVDVRLINPPDPKPNRW